MITKSDIKQKIKEMRPRISDKSIITYFTTVHNVGKYLTGEVQSHKIEDLEFLLDVEGVLEYFDSKGFTPSTTRTYLGQIISVFEAFNSLNNYDFSPIQDQYGEILETLILEAQNKRKKNPNESSARQKANWLDWEDIKEFHKKTKETLEHFGLPKEDMDVDEKMMYVNYIILSLYCADEDNPPLRNDYANMRVVDDEEKTDDEHNFLITSKPMRFMLNDYKTVKTYGKAILPVGKVLQPILEEYLTYNDSGYLINDAMNNPITTNVLSQRLIKMFSDGVGKRISTQLLRHSYITHHLPPEERKRKVLAKKMLHSPQMNLEYSLYIE
jgi:hypothetical protein